MSYKPKNKFTSPRGKTPEKNWNVLLPERFGGPSTKGTSLLAEVPLRGLDLARLRTGSLPKHCGAHTPGFCFSGKSPTQSPPACAFERKGCANIMRAAGLSNLGSESCESSFRERNQKKLCRDPSLLLPWGATSPLSPGLLETLLFLAHEARQSNSPSLGLWMSSHILKPMFSNPMISSTSTFPRDKFHNQQEWFYDSCWNSNFFSLYQFSIFQTRRLKAERLSHTLKVTRLGSDLGVRSRIQTQKCLATKPDSRFSLSSFYSKNEEPITGLSSPSAAQVQGLLISEYLVSQVPVYRESDWSDQLCLLHQPTLSRVSKGCQESLSQKDRF